MRDPSSVQPHDTLYARCAWCRAAILWNVRIDPGGHKRHAPANPDGTPHRCGRSASHHVKPPTQRDDGGRALPLF